MTEQEDLIGQRKLHIDINLDKIFTQPADSRGMKACTAMHSPTINRISLYALLSTNDAIKQLKGNFMTALQMQCRTPHCSVILQYPNYSIPNHIHKSKNRKVLSSKSMIYASNHNIMIIHSAALRTIMQGLAPGNRSTITEGSRKNRVQNGT